MEIAGKLMEKGFDFNELLDQTFFQKTYLQNRSWAVPFWRACF